MNESTRVHFREEQRFSQPWFWAIILVSLLTPLLILLYGLFQQLVLGIPWGDRPTSDAGLILVSLFTFTIILMTLLLFWIMRLETEVHDDGLWIRFVPFVRRKVLWHEIENFQARTYHPLREYGGWGIRWGNGGKAYNVIGNRGVQLQLKSGEKLLIGSQRADELAATMQHVARSFSTANLQ
jgi:hypothetical protein